MKMNAIVQELLTLEHDGPRVSIYMPTLRSGSEVRQNLIRFKNHVREAHAHLEARGINTAVIDALLALAKKRMHDEDFWNHQLDGLAMFLAPDFIREVRLTHIPGEITVVGSRFHLRPLLTRDALDQRFHVLALSQGRVQLYNAASQSLQPMSVDGLPKSLEDALGSELTNQHLNHHTAAAGSPALFHGQGRGKDDEDAELVKFCRLVDDCVVRAVDRSTPLVLAGVEHVIATYRSVSKHPMLAESTVSGSPERLHDDDLHAAAWSCLAPEHEAFREQAIARFESATATDTAMVELPKIVIAALDGRVDTLLFARDGDCVWGQVDTEQRRAATDDNPSNGAEDLLDRAVVEAFTRGAVLVPLDREHMPREAEAVAITRY